jgi:hypothetical protein
MRKQLFDFTHADSVDLAAGLKGIGDVEGHKVGLMVILTNMFQLAQAVTRRVDPLNACPPLEGWRTAIFTGTICIYAEGI